LATKPHKGAVYGTTGREKLHPPLIWESGGRHYGRRVMGCL